MSSHQTNDLFDLYLALRNVCLMSSGWDRQPKLDYRDIDRTNVAFEKYYKSQNIVPAEEWKEFMQSLRASLPTTFRITGTRESALEVRRQFEDHYFQHLRTVTFSSGEHIDPPRPIAWYPDRLAWHVK
eukprot:gene5852-9051_t